MLPKTEREDFLSTLANQYAVDHTQICQMAQKITYTEVNIINVPSLLTIYN